jgi:two-component system sensor histidine kinase/response regulator
MKLRYKVIIIDDEDIVLDSCTQILEGSNYDVATAANGTLGLQLVQEFQPDLVYVDLKMPGISGVEVLEKIKEIDPTIVAVVITGYATVSSAVEAMKQGAYDFLPKPFTPDEFRLITERSIERRRLTLETIALRREKEIMRENFAAIVSHELKSPIGSLQQNLFVMAKDLETVLSESQKTRLERMIARIDDVMKLIHSWLRVMSVDINKIRENFNPQSIGNSIAKAIEIIEPHANRKNIDVLATVSENISPILGEEVSFVEALVNIIGNAVKYSYPGSKVQVNAEEIDEYIFISIKDNGLGITKEELPYIFEDFYRGKSGQTQEDSHGLGLTISRRIIEAHDGTISVESKKDAGTTFTIKLPIYKNSK